MFLYKITKKQLVWNLAVNLWEVRKDFVGSQLSRTFCTFIETKIWTSNVCLNGTADSLSFRRCSQSGGDGGAQGRVHAGRQRQLHEAEEVRKLWVLWAHAHPLAGSCFLFQVFSKTAAVFVCFTFGTHKSFLSDVNKMWRVHKTLESTLPFEMRFSLYHRNLFFHS